MALRQLKNQQNEGLSTQFFLYKAAGKQQVGGGGCYGRIFSFPHFSTPNMASFFKKGEKVCWGGGSLGFHAMY